MTGTKVGNLLGEGRFLLAFGLFNNGHWQNLWRTVRCYQLKQCRPSLRFRESFRVKKWLTLGFVSCRQYNNAVFIKVVVKWVMWLNIASYIADA